MTAYEPGTVAMADSPGYKGIVFRYWREESRSNEWKTAEDGDYYGPDVRPLVVLDLDDYDWLPNRLRIDGDRIKGETGRRMHLLADQIEAQTRPPKPAEPTGLGAVVEDADGVRWVRNPDAGVICKWRNADRCWRNYGSIAAVRVLSEGVTA